MLGYRITGKGFHIGAGAIVLLSVAQAVERHHKLEPLQGGGGFGLARATETQGFKAGEYLGLAEIPKGQIHLVEPFEPQKGKKDEAAFAKAVTAFNDAAEEADLQRQIAIEEADKKRAEDFAKEQNALKVAEWADEYDLNEAIRAKYEKRDDYIAARRAGAEKPVVT